MTTDVAAGAKTTPVSGRVSLRAATDGDVAAVAAIEAASFGDPWSASEFSAVLTFGQAIFLVAVHEPTGELVGYLIAGTVLDEAEILNLAVSPARRGAGIGGRLLDAGLMEAGRRGALSFFLEVRESNAAGRALYRSRGFAEVSRRRRYYRSPVEDALVLRRAAQG